MLSENSAPLRDVIANFKTFSDALARNSDRVDSVVAGLERMTGGAGRARIPTYSLSALKTFPPVGQTPQGQLAVLEPAALMSLSNDKILIAYDSSDGTPIDNAQWGDNLPVLVQAKLIESLENSHYFEAVSRPVDGFEADQQLLTEVRAFRIDASPTPTARVAISAKLMREGRVTATQVVETSVPIASLEASSAVAGLNQAFAEALRQLVAWIAVNRAAPAAAKEGSAQ
jgi:phospholipid/cholesterol/gamma-HCH transport system substrate-binding protein